MRVNSLHLQIMDCKVPVILSFAVPLTPALRYSSYFCTKLVNGGQPVDPLSRFDKFDPSLVKIDKYPIILMGWTISTRPNLDLGTKMRPERVKFTCLFCTDEIGQGFSVRARARARQRSLVPLERLSPDAGKGLLKALGSFRQTTATTIRMPLMTSPNKTLQP